MKQNLALFDFDGTITRSDTFLAFIRYVHGDTRFVMGMLLLLPQLIMMKAGLLANWRVKEMVITKFFGGMAVEDFNKKAAEFALNVIPNLLKPVAVEKLKKHITDGDRVIVVSASAVNWVKPWTDTYQIELLATCLQQTDGKITGRLDGLNCYGPEKARRIRAHLDTTTYERIYAYGDSRGDREMLEMATEAFYRF